MANINIAIPAASVAKLLDWMQKEDILTDYHGVWPSRLVIELGWKPQTDAQPKPYATGIQVGFN